MDKDIITGSALDKSIALRVVEPLYNTLLSFSCHIVSVFLYWLKFNLIRVSQPLPKDEKSRKITRFAASDVRGIRSQKLIKHFHYTSLAIILQRKT